LQSSDTSEITLPATVIILAGQTNVFFDLNVIDDSILDGTQIVTVFRGSSPIYIGADAIVPVYDNESAALTITLPFTVSESAGSTTAIVTASSQVASDVAVLLNSSAPARLGVPPTVVIPAGQSSISFPVTILDNSAIEGTSSVTITAHVQNWTDAVKSIAITDDESPVISLSAPAVSERVIGARFRSRLDFNSWNALDESRLSLFCPLIRIK